jgi:hypothetical protein
MIKDKGMADWVLDCFAALAMTGEVDCYAGKEGCNEP